jgi:hypothetical protein
MQNYGIPVTLTQPARLRDIALGECSASIRVGNFANVPGSISSVRRWSRDDRGFCGAAKTEATDSV